MKYISIQLKDVIINTNHIPHYVELCLKSDCKYVIYTKNNEWIISFAYFNYILTEKTSFTIFKMIQTKYNIKKYQSYNITKFLLLKQIINYYLVNDLLKVIVDFSD
jgi:hypothetical protein